MRRKFIKKLGRGSSREESFHRSTKHYRLRIEFTGELVETEESWKEDFGLTGKEVAAAGKETYRVEFDRISSWLRNERNQETQRGTGVSGKAIRVSRLTKLHRPANPSCLRKPVAETDRSPRASVGVVSFVLSTAIWRDREMQGGR